MLANQQAYRRQLVHLASLVPDNRRRLVQRRLARRADGGTVFRQLVGGGDQRQRLAAMTQLAPGLLAAAPALAARALAPERIARVRFTAVGAILGGACLQVLDLGRQLLSLDA